MASPFGHALVGLGLLNLFYPRWFAPRRKTGLMFGLVILGACSPDLDFLPGLLWGNPGRFHHGPLHSLGMALGLSLMIGLFMIIIPRKQRTHLLKVRGSRFKVQGKTVNHPSFSDSHYETSNAGTYNPYRYLNITGFVFILVFSHLVLDFFTADFKAPFGFPLFWPFSNIYYISSRPVLPHVERDFLNPAIWGQILRVFIIESFFFLPFFFLSRRVRGQRAEVPPK